MAAISNETRQRTGKTSVLARREAIEMYICLAPWLIGVVVFTLGPMLASVVLSFMDWKLLKPPVWVGLDNFVSIFTSDPLFTKALVNTAYYTGFSVPLQLITAFLVAMLLNTRVRGLAIYRTIFYIPSVFSGVAVAIMWIWILHPNAGLLNQGLGILGIQGPNWLGNPQWAMPAMIIMSLWGGIGSPMVILLAGLQGVPQHLYEAAEVDGANGWHKLRHITLPMMSPVIFFSLVVGIVGSFQVFGASYILTGGGPNYATYTMVLKIYQNGFTQFRMGYATAQAWILFLILVTFTYLQFRLSRRWVYYETETVGKR
ncbi:MAG: sugar ABC transporter permease [Chloroflexi bacterium]|nr:sugar ABC transporter permease [Chloroflexota bacterium]